MSPVKKRTKSTVGDFKTQVENRNRLADLLTQAAQTEHDVMVQYLFAAFSLKKSISEGGVSYAQLEAIRGWATTIMQVARQEMEHLGLVSNLLTAIGEAPMLRRPALPSPALALPMNLPSSLDKFSPETVLRFVCYEMPKAVSSDNKKYLSRFIQNFDPSNYDGIYRTYMEIENLFEAIEPSDLFIGPPSAQFYSGGNSLIGQGMARGMIFPLPGIVGTPSPIYDIEMLPVTDLTSAKKVIKQIIEEGEGANEESTTSHFASFLAMHMQLMDELQKDPKFQPARSVVSNPRVADGDPALPGVTYITDTGTIKVMKAFDQLYSTMLLMLMRYFAHTDETDEELVGLQNTVFFPMMTLGIRPLAEMLTQLPAYATGGPLRAGPSFAIPESVQLLPHRKSAWRVILGELQYLTQLVEELTTTTSLPQPLRDRLTFTHENVARMTMNFQAAMQAREMK
jgi:ferritin-like protein